MPAASEDQHPSDAGAGCGQHIQCVLTHVRISQSIRSWWMHTYAHRYRAARVACYVMGNTKKLYGSALERLYSLFLTQQPILRNTVS